MMTVLRRMKKNPQYGKVTKDTKTEFFTGGNRGNGESVKRWFAIVRNLITLLPPLPPVQVVSLCDLCDPFRIVDFLNVSHR
jgi:hypothetical protein